MSEPMSKRNTKLYYSILDAPRKCRIFLIMIYVCYNMFATNLDKCTLTCVRYLTILKYKIVFNHEFLRTTFGFVEI